MLGFGARNLPSGAKALKVSSHGVALMPWSWWGSAGSLTVGVQVCIMKWRF